MERLLPIISRELNSNEKVLRFAKKGWCRLWSAEAFLAVRGLAFRQNLRLYLEIREVDFSNYISHSFLKVSKEDQVNALFFDGTGIGDFEPYFGFDSNAPTHLKESHLDVLNYYLQPEVMFDKSYCQ